VFEIGVGKAVLAYFLGSFVSLVSIVNPLSKIPLFASLTVGVPREVRLSAARRACMYAFAILTVSLFAGGVILEGFGISTGALRIAGGLTVLVVGYRMLFQPPDPAHVQVHDTPGADIAFFPLALPGISGPGSIAVVIGISTEITDIRLVANKAIAYGATVASIACVCVIVWIALRSAHQASRLLGPQGLDALSRLMGFLLICIGVQFIGSGVRSFVAGF
jgi:multiple antibiotic resistance protein